MLGCCSLIWYRIYWTFLDLAGFSDVFISLCGSLNFRKDFSGFLRIFGRVYEDFWSDTPLGFIRRIIVVSN